METVLMLVTFVSLVLAAVMAVLGWRLLRGERQRSAARVEALKVLAADEITEPAIVREAIAVRAPAVAVARFASIEEDDFAVESRAWDVTGREAWDTMPHQGWDDRRRAPREISGRSARGPAAHEIGERSGHASWDLGLGEARLPDSARRAPQLSYGASTPDAESEVMFGATAERGAPSRRWLALAAVGLFMAIGVGAVYVVYRPTLLSAVGSGDSNVPTTAARSAHPLELLSLRHTTDSDGTFSLTGLIQNPLDGQPARQVSAVVYLFATDGTYFASGRAALDAASLEPGAESPFVVRVPNAGRIGRYRVGFRLENGGVVAHVDHRGQPLVGMTEEETGKKGSAGSTGAAGAAGAGSVGSAGSAGAGSAGSAGAGAATPGTNGGKTAAGAAGGRTQ